MWTTVIDLAVVSAALHQLLPWYGLLTVLRWGAFFAISHNFWRSVNRLHRIFIGALTALLLQDFLLLLAPGLLKLGGLEGGVALRAHPLDHAKILWYVGDEADFIQWSSATLPILIYRRTIIDWECVLILMLMLLDTTSCIMKLFGRFIHNFESGASLVTSLVLQHNVRLLSGPIRVRYSLLRLAETWSGHGLRQWLATNDPVGRLVMCRWHKSWSSSVSTPPGRRTITFVSGVWWVAWM